MQRAEVECYIRDNCVWAKIPITQRQNWTISHKEYDELMVEYSIKNQLRYGANAGELISKVHIKAIALMDDKMTHPELTACMESWAVKSGACTRTDVNRIVCDVAVRFIKKGARQYYEELLQYSRQSLMLYPYHLSDVVVSGLSISPFTYYIGMMEAIMLQEKSYDSLPNFTAADCVRLLGIGRNEYIDLMNQCRSGRKLFRRRNVKDHLPSKPARIPIEPWWMVYLGMVTEDDVKHASNDEKALIDKIIDHRGLKAGMCDRELLHSLYSKGLVYLGVPVNSKDYIVVPPLEGFVMNRVLGDYFETLLYKIFVSIDEQTSVGELASVLEIDLESVQDAVSLYCRLGFAKKKGSDVDLDELHPSWNRSPSLRRQGSVISVTDPLLLELDEVLAEAGLVPPDAIASTDSGETALFSSPARSQRVAFLFDSTLTAFLMMGNLSPGLKNHAVTMFEVGKLSDESLDSLLAELEKISTDDSEGEAQRYFEHALVLRATIKFLRHDIAAPGLDLIRCESLQSLDAATCSRLLNKNYTLLVSMAPLSKEIRPISSRSPPHLGPAVPEMNTPWFKLYLYHVTGSGPPTLLLPQGTRLRRLPQALRPYTRVLLANWGHDPAPLPLAHLLLAANEALAHSSVLLQGLGETVKVPFPLPAGGWADHPAVQTLGKIIDLKHNCGFVTLVRLAGTPGHASGPSLEAAATLACEVDGLEALPPGPWAVLDCDFGVPLFSASVNELVCGAITRQKLWEPESLQILVESSNDLEKKFLQFIDNIQESPETFPNTDAELQKATTLLPRNSWQFDDGKLKLWDSR